MKIKSEQDTFDKEIPSIDIYPEADRYTDRLLLEALEMGWILGWLRYGSIVQGDPYSGSDLERAIVYNSELIPDSQARNFTGSIEGPVRERFGITLNLHPAIGHDTPHFPHGEMSHSSEDSRTVVVDAKGKPFKCKSARRFVTYLGTCCASPKTLSENVVGVNPMDFFHAMKAYRKPATYDEKLAEMKERMAFVRTRLGASASLRSNMEDGIISELLELSLREPVFTALDMLWLATGKMPTNPADGRLVTKRGVADAYIKAFPDHDPSDLVASVEAFTKYRLTINSLSRMSLTQRQPYRNQYRTLLRELYEHVEGSMRFVQECYDRVESGRLDGSRSLEGVENLVTAA